MSVVGIDLGNLNTVVAVARNRGIDVIANEASSRATPSLASFGDRRRFLGEAARTLEVSNFKNTVASLKRLAGRPADDPDVALLEQRFVNASIVPADDGSGLAAADVTFQGVQRSFSFAQIVAMFLVHVREFTAAELKTPVSDCVISCPSWFSDAQRRAVLDASLVAGLRCLRLLNDTTAAALGYGITKTDLPDAALPSQGTPSAADAAAAAAIKPRIVTFVDLGHSSLQVAVVSFVKGKLVVKGTAWDRNLGGRDFDQVLTDHFIDIFDAKYKVDIRSSKKAVYRLRQAAEKVKKILSANAVTMINVECLIDDKDVSSDVKRADFETLAAPLVQRIIPPLEAALAAAGVSPNDVDSVELVGGSTRIPSVKEAIAKFFGGSVDGPNKLSTTLNQDEAVARGCALQCAIISPVFKVRDFSSQEWNGYPIELAWDPAQVPAPKNGADPSSVVSRMEAFPLGNTTPSSKILSFVRALKDDEIAAGNGTVDFVIRGEYPKDSAASRNFPIGAGTLIGSWSIKGIKRLPSTEIRDESGAVVGAKAIIKVKAKLDTNGILSIEAANQVEEVMVPVEEPKPEEAAAAATATADAKKAAAPAADASTPAEVGNSTESMDIVDDAVPVTTQAQKDVKMKKVIRRHELGIVPHPVSASKDLVDKWVAAEGDMYASDRLVIDTAERRNALEEYVYETRSKLEMAWSDYATDADRSALMKRLADMEDWLYGDGEEATKSVYMEKLADLRKASDPIAYRYQQAEDRPLAERVLRDYANTVMVSLSAEDGRYDHLTKDEIATVTTLVRVKLDWLNDVIGKQNERAKHLDVVVSSDAIYKEKAALEGAVLPVLNKPKPKPAAAAPTPAPAADAAPPKNEGADAAADQDAKKTAPAEQMDID